MLHSLKQLTQLDCQSYLCKNYHRTNDTNMIFTCNIFIDNFSNTKHVNDTSYELHYEKNYGTSIGPCRLFYKDVYYLHCFYLVAEQKFDSSFTKARQEVIEKQCFKYVPTSIIAQLSIVYSDSIF